MSELTERSDGSEFEDRQDNAVDNWVTEPNWVSSDAKNLLDRMSDLEVVAMIRKDAMDPAGTYLSDPDELPLTTTVETFKGRISVQVNGLVTLVKPRDKGMKLPEHAVRTRLNFFRLSPDRRNKLVYGEDNKPLLNDDGTPQETSAPDAQSLRWLEAREAYKTLYGEEAKKDLDVVTFLTERPIYFVMFQGRNGLGVSKIYAKK